MTRWHAERTPDRPAKAMIAVTLLAMLLVAAVPVALLAAVVMMMLGYVAGGLALFGGSVRAHQRFSHSLSIGLPPSAIRRVRISTHCGWVN